MNRELVGSATAIGVDRSAEAFGMSRITFQEHAGAVVRKFHAAGASKRGGKTGLGGDVPVACRVSPCL